MTTTVGNQTGRGRLPVASRDRRPALAALALLLIVGGGLGAGLIVYRSGQQVTVLAAGKTIHAGDTLSPDNLTTVRISGADSHTIASGSEASFLGSVSTTTIPSGTLLNPGMFHTKNGLIPRNGQAVGIPVPSTQRPSSQFAAGDIVQAYYVSKGNSSTGSLPQGATAIATPVQVIGVSSSGSGSTVISVLVNQSTAQQLINPASQGNVALTKMPYGTTPELSLTGK